MAGATLFICINIQVNNAPCTDEIFIAFLTSLLFHSSNQMVGG